jgi:hypothetical protein
MLSPILDGSIEKKLFIRHHLFHHRIRCQSRIVTCYINTESVMTSQDRVKNSGRINAVTVILYKKFILVQKRTQLKGGKDVVVKEYFIQ